MKLRTTDATPETAGRPGLTLVETVVAVSLLSSVAALLVPSLGAAREDAKRLACQSQLGQTGTAMLSYRADLGAFPLYPTTSTSFCTWYFGGWSGRNREHWKGQAGGVWNIQTNQRPLTVYMTPWQIPDEADPLTPTQEAPLFKCPSDDISSAWLWSGVQGYSSYDDVGTSYELNFYWWGQVDSADTPDDCGICWEYKIAVLGGNIFNKYAARQPERFVTLMEVPAAWALAAAWPEPGLQVTGYHGDFSTHMVAFADGHAEYLYMDTRHLHDSQPIPPGQRHGPLAPSGRWTVCDENKEHPSGGRHEL